MHLFSEFFLDVSTQFNQNIRKTNRIRYSIRTDNYAQMRYGEAVLEHPTGTRSPASCTKFAGGT